MRIIAITLLSVLALTACKSPYVSEISEIDSLLVELDSAKKILYMQDTGKAFERIRVVEQNIAKLYRRMDTVSPEEAIVIGNYANFRKYYSKWVKRFPTYFESIETIPVQLKNLRTDLTKNLIPEDKVDGYFNNEKKAAGELVKGIHDMKSNFDFMDMSFDSNHEKILHLIQSLDTTAVSEVK